MGDWYSARLLFESVHDDNDPDAEHLWEESTVVFRCESGEDIGSKLTTLAKKGELSYANVYGNRVNWTFRELLEIQEISGYEVTDGTEVFFRWWNDPDAQDFEFMRRTHTEPWWPQLKQEE